ncbi:MAG: hypothetical protein Q4C30_01030 [Bacteroidia bacterium]|nr:hypothetical protein [Bacteroidia bacterium]
MNSDFMRGLVVSLIMFVSLVQTNVAQNIGYALHQADSIVNVLKTTHDTYFYSATVNDWIADTKELFLAATGAEIDSAKMEAFGRVNIPIERDTARVLYFIHHQLKEPQLVWFLRLNHTYSPNIETYNQPSCYAFQDNISKTALDDNKKDAKSESMLTGESMPMSSTLRGFEVVDSVTSHIFYWVPDVLLRVHLESLADINVDFDVKEYALERVQQKMDDLYSLPDIMKRDLRGLTRVVTISDPDSKVFKMSTYCVSYPDFTTSFHGMIAHDADGRHYVDRLEDKTAEIMSPERGVLSPAKWYGAVYYNVIPFQVDKKQYYTLLGYKASDGLVKTRVVEILSFKAKRVAFGAPLFLHEKATYHRRVMKYSAQANMMMRYDERISTLVMDHLSPPSSMLRGQWRYYGPDMSYDGYKLTKQGWQFADDLDITD